MTLPIILFLTPFFLIVINIENINMFLEYVDLQDIYSELFSFDIYTIISTIFPAIIYYAIIYYTLKKENKYDEEEKEELLNL